MSIHYRYIEIFKSSLSEMESSLNASMRPFTQGFGGRNFGGPAPRGGRPGPYDRMMGRGPPPPRPRDDGYGGGKRRFLSTLDSSYRNFHYQHPSKTIN